MEDLTGMQIGPYQILESLGEGGMAAVYRGRHTAMDRLVAIKILPKHFASDPHFVLRFRREAKILSELQHPHILPVFDFGESDGYTYIVLPYIKGGTLLDLLRGRPLPLAQIRSVISQVGDALDCAHEHGLVHRDVKPSNVLVDERGNCLLSDFGLAKVVEGPDHLTTSGVIVGTPLYMSPEQCMGEKPDSRSDVYSLGVILYEMATGRPPFRAETPMGVVFKHVNDPLPPARSFNPEVLPGLERVLDRALAKDPRQRFQSARDLVWSVQAVTPEPVTTVAPPPPAAEQPTIVAAGGAPPRPGLPLVVGAGRGRRPLLVLLAGALVLSICAAFWALSQLSPTGAPFLAALWASPTASPTGTVAPTPSLAASATPRPPTATPRPTRTPSPSLTTTLTPTATRTARPTAQAVVRTVTVAATQLWQDTGLIVQRGNTVVIQVLSGSWTTGKNALDTHPYVGGGGYDPEPADWADPPDGPQRRSVPGVVTGALVGRVEGGAAFRVGPSLQFQPDATGKLYLGINDLLDGIVGDVSDNDGALVVQITIYS